MDRALGNDTNLSGTMLRRTGDREIKDLISTDSPLPEKPDREVVEQWMIAQYLAEWR
jgi:hypothetical protein